MAEFRIRICNSMCSVSGREVEPQLHYRKVPNSIPVSGFQLMGQFISQHIRRECWRSSQEAESKKINIIFRVRTDLTTSA